MTYPKIELHVHLEGTVRPAALLRMARRNDYALPANSPREMAALYEFEDFTHFLKVWALTTNALRTEQDFREVVVDYAAEAAAHGAIYLEGIFSPAEAVARGMTWEEAFAGCCDGVQEARERYGIQVALTPDIPRNYPIEAAELTVTYAIANASRGVVGVGLGGSEAHPPAPFKAVFARAKDAGLGSVPHAGENGGPVSIRSALTALGADRIRHGIRAVQDQALVTELAERGIVLDVCPTSNLRTGVVSSLAEHPLPALLAAGVSCTINTDDPAMFGTDLGTEHAVALALGATARASYEAGVKGALCDDVTKTRLRQLGDEFDWSAATEQATA
ncbi:MAG TPA: adenosine deaminase [Streptosporangiaceae bacterium]|nr:adenosine deaminase [Streptosporangiaceae bacterium]